MLKHILLVTVFFACISAATAQELQAKVSVNAERVGTKVDKKIFQTLQSAIANFLNNRKWTGETFQQNEKINCNFLLSIKTGDNNIYTATLTVQAARPVFNSSYVSPLINFIDESVVFRYVEFQNLEFNENRVAGNDATAANLTATLAYYAYIILGLDFDSYALKGGEQYYIKAQNIVNNAPDGRDITGWKAFDGQRNRYWLIDNLTNNKYNLLHDAIYAYYRQGLDNMYDKETEARTGILNTLNFLNTVNTDFPNIMFIPFFFQGKSNELIKIFKKAPVDEKSRASDLLVKLDITNANNYKQELK
jgi:Domain of unknown function (DUF4835)